MYIRMHRDSWTIKKLRMTNLQLELIKIFSYELNDSQVVEIKDMLSKYFANKATQEVDKLWEENNWSDETMDQWANEHLRTPLLTS